MPFKWAGILRCQTSRLCITLDFNNAYNAIWHRGCDRLVSACWLRRPKCSGVTDTRPLVSSSSSSNSSGSSGSRASSSGSSRISRSSRSGRSSAAVVVVVVDRGVDSSGGSNGGGSSAQRVKGPQRWAPHSQCPELGDDSHARACVCVCVGVCACACVRASGRWVQLPRTHCKHRQNLRRSHACGHPPLLSHALLDAFSCAATAAQPLKKTPAR